MSLNNQNFKIELLDSSEYHKNYKTELFFRIKQIIKQISIKFLIQLIIWIILFRQSVKLELLQTYIIFSFIYLIFNNLGTRQANELSAYSVFNKNFQKLLGDSDGGVEAAMGLQKTRLQNDEFDDEIDQKTIEQIQNKEKWNKIPYSKKGNLPCICESGKKFKKCCYWEELKEKQLEKEKQKDL